jgi:hypothetical protein
MTEQTKTAGAPVELRVGQIWQEVDPRFEAPHKEIRGFTDDGKVVLGPPNRSNGTTKAQPKRFNGKRGGYRLIKDVAPDA